VRPPLLRRFRRGTNKLGFDDVEAQPGWALTGTLAAVAYGAPVAARSDYPPEFYVPTPRRGPLSWAWPRDS